MRSIFWLAASFALWASPALADFAGVCKPNTVVAGPTSGAGAAPICRSLVVADIPKLPTTRCPSIMSFGGDPTGATDNTAAWTAVLGGQTTNPCVYFPKGKYKFLSTLPYTFPADKQAIVVQGDGPDVSELTWPNPVGTALLLNLVGITDHVHVRDLTFSTGSNNVDDAIKVVQQSTAGAGTAISSGQVQSDFSNLAFRSAEGVWEETGAATNHVWKNGVNALDTSFLLFTNVQAWGPSSWLVNGYATASSPSGNGVSLAGTHASGPFPVVFNFRNCNFQWLSNGVILGSWIQGVSISQSNFTGNYSGVGVPPNALALNQLSIASGNQFGNMVSLNLLSSISNLVVSGNGPFILPNLTGAMGINYPMPSFGTAIVGNTFNGLLGSSKGIILNGSGNADNVPAVVTSNVLFNMGTGITLGAGATGAIVSDNLFSGNMTNVVNNGASNVVKGLGGAFATISAVTNNGSGVTRLTLSPATSMFVTGEQVSIGGTAYASANVVTTITVIDSTHFDLPNVLFAGGPYAGGGIVSTIQ
jgi:hypothetical protein